MVAAEAEAVDGVEAGEVEDGAGVAHEHATRSRLSRTAVSGSPTTLNWNVDAEATYASTLTGSPSIPLRAMHRARASINYSPQ